SSPFPSTTLFRAPGQSFLATVLFRHRAAGRIQIQRRLRRPLLRALPSASTSALPSVEGCSPALTRAIERAATARIPRRTFLRRGLTTASRGVVVGRRTRRTATRSGPLVFLLLATHVLQASHRGRRHRR